MTQEDQNPTSPLNPGADGVDAPQAAANDPATTDPVARVAELEKRVTELSDAHLRAKAEADAASLVEEAERSSTETAEALVAESTALRTEAAKERDDAREALPYPPQ